MRERELERAFAAFAAYSGVLLALDLVMRRTGGGGIVALEWAGTPRRADAVLRRWGRGGRRAAWASLALEPGYAVSFAWLLMALRRRLAPDSGSTPAAALAPAAGALDLLQTVALLLVMNGRRDPWPRVARWSSFTKFGLMGLDLATTAAAAARD